MRHISLTIAILPAALPVAAKAQLATIGAGVLLSDRRPEPVAELHAETPPVRASRACVTLSWTDESAKPTVITAAERALLQRKVVVVGPRSRTPLAGGKRLPALSDYRDVEPRPIADSSHGVVAIGSTQPFQEFECRSC